MLPNIDTPRPRHSGTLEMEVFSWPNWCHGRLRDRSLVVADLTEI